MIEIAVKDCLAHADVGNEVKRKGPKWVSSEQANALRLVHDLNNALTVILTSANMIRAELPVISSLTDDVNEVYKQARGAVSIAQKLSEELRKLTR